jgi:hypothetical protein
MKKTCILVTAAFLICGLVFPVFGETETSWDNSYIDPTNTNVFMLAQITSCGTQCQNENKCQNTSGCCTTCASTCCTGPSTYCCVQRLCPSTYSTTCGWQ